MGKALVASRGLSLLTIKNTPQEYPKGVLICSLLIRQKTCLKNIISLLMLLEKH